MKLGSDNINGHSKPDYKAAEKAIGDFLTALQIDWAQDPNMRDTPKRVAKMFIEELYCGRYNLPPDIRDFSSNHKHSSLLVSGPWDVKSSCAHHILPVSGMCFIGILPKEKSPLSGLSKYGRIVDYFARRPTLQEDLVEQIADFCFEQMKPEAIGVYISARHMCCTHRGINATASEFITTALRGEMFDMGLKQEFLNECHLRLNRR